MDDSTPTHSEQAEQRWQSAASASSPGWSAAHMALGGYCSTADLKLLEPEEDGQYVPGWRFIPDNELAVTTLSGGASNRIYITHWTRAYSHGNVYRDQHDCTKCDEKSMVRDSSGVLLSVPERAIVRVFGPNSEYFVDRRRESSIATWLSLLGFGPKVYGSFGTGRVEEVLSGRSLTIHDMRLVQILEALAVDLADLHCLSAAETLELNPEPMLFTTISKWMRRAASVELPPTHRSFDLLQAILQNDLPRLAATMVHVQETIDALDSPVVFCHNDVNEGNIVLQSETTECIDGLLPNLRLIDYEFAQMNYRGFDIGNVFCECAIQNSAPEFPYFKYEPHSFPCSTVQRAFARRYLMAVKENESPDAPDDVIDAEVTALCDEANLFCITSHAYWATWALIQAENSDIKFGYVEYAKVRFDAFFQSYETRFVSFQ